jgi:hypothetical protein
VPGADARVVPSDAPPDGPGAAPALDGATPRDGLATGDGQGSRDVPTTPDLPPPALTDAAGSAPGFGPDAPDGAEDAPAGPAEDVLPDAAVDAEVDAPVDAEPATDAPEDTPPALTVDAEPDAQPDAPEDTPPALTVDAEPDAQPEAAADASTISADANADTPPAGYRGTATCLGRHPTALFCDDFENGLPTGYPDYSYFSNHGTVTASADRVKQGAQAFRGTLMRVPGQISQASLWRSMTAIQSGSLHVRAHFYLPSGFVVSNWFVSLQLGGPAGKLSFDLIYEDRMQIAVNTENAIFRSTNPNTYPRDRWFCAELVIHLGELGGAGSAEVHVDGQKVLEAPIGTDTLPAGGYDYLMAGAPHANGLSAAGEVFMDDVVLATSPIGCQ